VNGTSCCFCVAHPGIVGCELEARRSFTRSVVTANVAAPSPAGLFETWKFTMICRAADSAQDRDWFKA